MKLHEVIYEELLSPKFQESGYSVVGANFGKERERNYMIVSDGMEVWVVDIKKLEV